MAFVTPVNNPILTPASRRATAVCRKPPRQTPTMKKLRRGATADEEENAVDVFGGAGMSQEELLAAALGEDNPSPQPKQKKKKKTKKGALPGNDENAVDVFAGTNLSQEELLAQALGDDVEEEGKSTRGKKLKKKPKKGVVDNEEYAADVSEEANLSQQGIPTNALGEPTEEIQDASVQLKKQKKKKRKKGAVDDDDNAADVFGNVGISQEELLADALGESIDEGRNARQEGRRGSKSIQSDEASMSDTGLDTELSQKQLSRDDFRPTADNADQTLKSFSSPPIVGSADMVSRGVELERSVGEQIEETDEDVASVIPDGTEIYSTSAAEEATLDNEAIAEDEDFEPDVEVVDEFESVAAELKDFTRAGRREKSKSKRAERAQADGRLSDPKRANFGSGAAKFTSVRLEDVTVTFRNSTILNGVTWGVKTGERVGLIGENGCGKTTQLRLIAGLMEPTSGEVVSSSSRTRASFLRQEFVDELDPRRTLREEFITSFSMEMQLLAEYNQCEKEISEAGEDLEKLEMLLNRLEELRTKCDQTDAWNLDSRIDKVMPGLGFIEDDNDKLVASFSGGWKVRIGLGKVLLQDPDLLLLDEPSNHLDSESVEWLEEFLQTCKLPMIVVSHDREFLDRVCTKIVEIEGGEAFEYPGNYSKYVKLRQEQRKAWEAAYEKQQRFVKEQESYIKRNRRSPARASQVKSRQRMLDRMERTGQMVRRPPRRGKPLVFRFPLAPRSGRDCIIIDELTHGYEEKVLFKDASIAIERGDRIALIGPNGCGKSTLLRLITGREQAQHGAVSCQDLTNISLAYYEQNQADALNLEITALETLKKAAPSDMRYEQIRALLGKFLFKGDDVEKTVGSLSGGEKARLALAKIMMEPANVLVLDEPGNHLSISAKEMLEEALQHFDGTLLLVSHDRYLISQVATQILAVEDNNLVLYDGDYKSYMEKNQELKERLQARFIPGVAEIKNAPKIVIEEPVETLDKKQKRKKNFGGSGVQSGRTKEMNAKRWNK